MRRYCRCWPWLLTRRPDVMRRCPVSRCSWDVIASGAQRIRRTARRQPVPGARVSLPRSVPLDRGERRVHRPRRADGAVHLQPAGYRRQAAGLLRHAAEERPGEAEAGRQRRHLGLPAPGHVLVQHHHVRHPVVAELHARRASRTATPTRGFRSSNPKSPHYIGKSPGNAFMELQFYAPGWVPQFAGFGCSATHVVREPDHRQPLRPGQHGRPAERATAWTTTSWSARSRSTGPTSRRAASPQAPANPLALSDDPTLKGLNPDLKQGPADEPGRQAAAVHARHAAPATGSTSPT